MKITYRNIKTYLSVALVAGALFSCSEDKMDKINQDIDNPHNVDAKFILTDVITSTAFSNVGGDFNHYFASYTEHEVGVFNQLYNAEQRLAEVYTSSTFNNVWMNAYSTLKNARLSSANALKRASSRETIPQKVWAKCWLPSMPD